MISEKYAGDLRGRVLEGHNCCCFFFFCAGAVNALIQGLADLAVEE